MKILLAVDDSEYSTAAVNEVAQRTWPRRSTLRILKVIEPFPIGVEPWVGESEGLDQIDAELKRRASRLIKKITEQFKKKDLTVQSVIRNGQRGLGNCRGGRTLGRRPNCCRLARI